MSAKKTFGTSEVAKKEGVTRQRIGQLLKMGRIPGAEKLGRDWRIPNPYTILPGPKIGRPRATHE